MIPSTALPCDALTQGSFFTGIAGLDLGLERAGFHIIWQSEVKPSAVAVLERHYPNVPNLGDITTIDWTSVETPTLLHGGFPCQDLSHAHTNGKRKLLAGDKSGLWTHFRAGIEALGPPWVLVENVDTWRSWVPQVRSDLSRLGYASMPLELSAGSFGAPHKRPRCFVVAHADGNSESLLAIHAEVAELRPLSRSDSRHWPQPPSRTVLLDDGLPERMGQNDLYGNAVVPQVAEWLGEQIKAQIVAEREEAVA
jgi:DNA (cytosine-5)-methyltransferase 1